MFQCSANSLLEIKHIINHSQFDQLALKARELLAMSRPDDIENGVAELNREFN